MRRFSGAQRDEDLGQIQYLTAECSRLVHDKALLDREVLLSRDKERRLQNDLEAAAAQLHQQEQLNMELRMKQDRLVSRIHQQEELLEVLQQRLVLLVEQSSRDEELLQQVDSELLSLQSSEVRLQGLLEELRAEAHGRAAEADSLQAELHSKTTELKTLQDDNKTLREELKGLRCAHRKQVRKLQQENEASLGKLQETAEQFEWLCQQQRYWMGCVKTFKDCLTEERDALLRQVGVLEKKAEEPKNRLQDGGRAPSAEPDAKGCDSSSSWGGDLDEELLNQTETPISESQQPP